MGRYCINCGKELVEGAAYCPHCGAHITDNVKNA